MSGLRKSKKNSEVEDKFKDIPSLSVSHFREISALYRKYGCKLWKLLVYWKAAKMDDRGHIIAILDWSSASEYELSAYESFEPLKGIRYMGTGFLTYTPYNWVQEWVKQWEWWLEYKATAEEKKGILSESKQWRKTPSLSLEPSATSTAT